MTAREQELIDCGEALVPSLKVLRPHEVLKVLSTALVLTSGWSEQDWLERFEKIAPEGQLVLDRCRSRRLSDADMIVLACFFLDAIGASMEQFEEIDA